MIISTENQSWSMCTEQKTKECSAPNGIPLSHIPPWLKVCGNSVRVEAVDEDKETESSGHIRESASSHK